jgi:hypothetical protein
MYDVVLPTTVLIGRDGFIEGITHPRQVTESMLNDLFQGRPLRLPVTLLPNNIGGDRTLTGQKVGDDSRAAVRIAVTPVFGKSPSGLVNTESRLDTESATLRPLLSFAYSVSARQIILPRALQEGRYAVHAWVPPRRGDLMRPLLQQALAAAVDFHAAWEEREVDVLILDGPPEQTSQQDRQRTQRPGHQ